MFIGIALKEGSMEHKILFLLSPVFFGAACFLLGHIIEWIKNEGNKGG